MRIAPVQVASPESESVADRRARVGDLIRSAASADLIVLPELWPSGYFAFDDYDRDAEPADGPTVRQLSALARETGSYLHAGSFVERLPDGALRNTACLLDPAGAVVHTYSKIHVFATSLGKRSCCGRARRCPRSGRRSASRMAWSWPGTAGSSTRGERYSRRLAPLKGSRGARPIRSSCRPEQFPVLADRLASYTDLTARGVDA